MAALTLVAIHLGGAYVALGCSAEGGECLLPGTFDIPPPLRQPFFFELFKQLLLLGAFLYALLIAFWSFGRRPASFVKPVAGVFALSLAIAILIAADSSLRPVEDSAVPTDLAGLIYTLVTQRQALLALSVIIVGGIAIATYYLIRSAFAVEYTGAGVQIKIPGHTVYYVPIYPQVSWQDTGIALEKGEKVSIELSGLVSPGALHSKVLSAWTDHMDSFVEWQVKYVENKSTLEELRKIETPGTWPYTRPEGYRAEWYEGDEKLEVMKQHKLYQKDGFYKDDTLLTVKGLPHNTVIGFIQCFGDAKPKDTLTGNPAYDWGNEDDRKRLLLLSARRYPLAHQEVPRSGKLWVVINDVDLARWDNAGMFFLKLTRRSWL